jgi:hypothetical protein
MTIRCLMAFVLGLAFGRPVQHWQKRQILESRRAARVRRRSTATMLETSRRSSESGFARRQAAARSIFFTPTRRSANPSAPSSIHSTTACQMVRKRSLTRCFARAPRAR